MRTNKVVRRGITVVKKRDLSKGETAFVVFSTTQSSLRTVTDITRDDIIKTPVKYGFRKPLPYTASGVVNDFPAIYAEALYDDHHPVNRLVRDVLVEGNSTTLAEPPSLVGLIPQADISRGIVNMLRAVGDQKWSAGEMLAEMQGSIDTIADGARSIANAMLHASRKNWRGVARSLGVPPKKVKSGSSTATGWLSYQFGWAPIVNDMAMAALYLGGDLDERDPMIIMARTKLRDEVKGSSQGSTIASFGIGQVSFPYKGSSVVKDEWCASVYFEANMKSLRELTKYGLLGLSTPWAVLPLSFLADWILPIGDVLEAMDAQIGLTYKGGSETRFKSASATRSYDKAIGSVNTTILRSSAAMLPVQKFSMVRSVWTSPPVPWPTYIKNPFDVFKAVTSVALLKQFSSNP